MPSMSEGRLADPGRYLQPQTFGSILSHTYGIYFEHLPSLCTMYVILLLPVVLAQEALSAAGYSYGVVLVSFVNAFMNILADAVLTILVADICLGIAPDNRRALWRGWRNPKLVGTVLCTGLLCALALTVFVIPGLILSIRYMFVAQAVVLEDLSYGAAMRRSRDLVQGNAWRNVLVWMVAGATFSIPLTLVPIVLGETFAGLVPSLIPLWSVHLALDILGVVAAPLLSLPVILLYFDMRARNEMFGAAQLRQELEA